VVSGERTVFRKSRSAYPPRQSRMKSAIPTAVGGSFKSRLHTGRTWDSRFSLLSPSRREGERKQERALSPVVGRT